MTAEAPRRLVVASANPHKVKEIAAVLGAHVAVELVPRPAHVPEVVEDAETLLGNARLKARALAAATDEPAVADDTGLEVDALGGDPGVYSARYAGEGATYADNVEKLLPRAGRARGPGRSAPRPLQDRGPGGLPRRGRGVGRGRGRREHRHRAPGCLGFGYDPVFVPDHSEGGDGRTFAQMEGGREGRNLTSRPCVSRFGRAPGAGRPGLTPDRGSRHTVAQPGAAGR